MNNRTEAEKPITLLGKIRELLNDREKEILELKKAKEALELIRIQLEEKVKERTEELQKRVTELEKFQKLTIGRELKMIELKQEIKKLQDEVK